MAEAVIAAQDALIDKQAAREVAYKVQVAVLNDTLNAMQEKLAAVGQ